MRQMKTLFNILGVDLLALVQHQIMQDKRLR